MANGQTLVEELNSISRRGFLDKYKIIPDFVLRNINPRFEMRKYQIEALARFIYFLSDENTDKSLPIHLLFNMATGSGKTFLMASNILYLYKLGYRNFIFFVNSTTIIKKTKANFLDKSSPKYLFAEKVVFNDKEVQMQEVDNFEGVNQNSINIFFTTIQGLYSRIWTPQENVITLEDFKNKKIVFLSDEAHHINVLTRNLDRLSPVEQEETKCWEKTVIDIFNVNPANVLLEYTATVEQHQNIFEKYKNKIVYQYTLKEFREDKFSKDVQIMQSDLDLMDRALQAVILSQYRRKVAEKHKIQLKPVILVKSQKTIAQSENAVQKFKAMIKSLKVGDIKKIEKSNSNGIITKAFTFFKDNGITCENLVREIKSDFSEEKCIAVNSQADSDEKQIKVNTLEAEHNETRVIFTVTRVQIMIEKA